MAVEIRIWPLRLKFFGKFLDFFVAGNFPGTGQNRHGEGGSRQGRQRGEVCCNLAEEDGARVREAEGFGAGGFGAGGFGAEAAGGFGAEEARGFGAEAAGGFGAEAAGGFGVEEARGFGAKAEFVRARIPDAEGARG